MKGNSSCRDLWRGLSKQVPTEAATPIHPLSTSRSFSVAEGTLAIGNDAQNKAECSEEEIEMYQTLDCVPVTRSWAVSLPDNRPIGRWPRSRGFATAERTQRRSLFQAQYLIVESEKVRVECRMRRGYLVAGRGKAHDRHVLHLIIDI
jgi:hypothetical protein